MLPKCTVLLIVLVVVHSATLQGRNIPVEIRYERYEHDTTSNLAEKLQLSQEELQENQLRLQKLSLAEEDLTPSHDHLNLIKNLDEKVQLSPDELQQTLKHIPGAQENIEVDKLGELRVASVEKDVEQPVLTTASKVTLLQQAQDVIEQGLDNLRKNFRPTGKNDVAPPKELWDKLEDDVKEYFSGERNKLGLKQSEQGGNQQNFFQNLASGFQQITNNFVQSFQGQNPAQNATSGDEGQGQPVQGAWQGFVGYFQGGVQNIVNTVQSIGGSGPQLSGNSTVLGDSGNQQPSNVFSNIFTNVQQLFQGQNPGNNEGNSANSSQGDTVPNNQQGFFAGAINQFNQVVSNIIPTSPAPPPATQGDEGTNITAPAQQGPIQQVFQSFGNLGTAFNQFIQGGPQQNKPQGPEDEKPGNQPPTQNFIQSIGQNIGNAVQNIQNQFRPPGTSTQKPVVEDEKPVPETGIAQVLNIGQNITNTIQTLIPATNNQLQNTNLIQSVGNAFQSIQNPFQPLSNSSQKTPTEDQVANVGIQLPQYGSSVSKPIPTNEPAGSSSKQPAESESPAAEKPENNEDAKRPESKNEVEKKEVMITAE